MTASASRIRNASTAPPAEPATRPMAAPISEVEAGAGEAHRERDPAAVEQAQQHVAAELVRAERVVGARRLGAGQQVDRLRVLAEEAGHRRGERRREREC